MIVNDVCGLGKRVTMNVELYRTKKPAGRGGLRELAVPCSSKFGSVRATRALQDDSMYFSLRRASARKPSVSRAWSSLCGKKNPLWDTILHCDTRSVPYLKGRTVARRSFPEDFLELSATYDNGSRSGRAAHLHGETCAIAARKFNAACYYSNTVYFFVFSWKFLNYR